MIAVTSVKLVSSYYGHQLTITIEDKTLARSAVLTDLPADMQEVLLKWVNGQ